ncbi:MAG: OadG family transporter subunit [Verrucomicrobiota bacterium]
MNVFPSLPIAAMADSPEALNLLFTGFSFVVVVLALLALLTFVGGKFFAKRAAVSVLAVPNAPRAADLIKQKEAVEGQVAAVVTAAVYLALQDHHFRVHSIRPTQPGGWAQEGRRQLFSSHRVR